MDGKDFPVISALANTTNYVARLGIIPYKWPKGNKELEIRKQNGMFRLLKLFMLSTEVLFMFYQSYHYFRADDIQLFQKIHVFYTTMGISIVAYNTSLVYRDPTAMHALVNNLVRICGRFYGTQIDRVPMEGCKSVIKGLRLLKFMCTFIPLTFSIRIMRNPGSNRYLTSLLPEPEKTSKAVRAAVGLFHMAAIGLEFFVFMFTFSFALVFVCVAVDIMKNLRLKSTSSRPPSDGTLRRLCIQTQRLGVLMQHFNATYGTYMLSNEVLGIVTIVVNTTLAVVHESARALVIAMMLFILLIYAYKTFGTVYEEGKVASQTWSSRETSAWFRRYCRAYRPARILIGSFYYADRSLTLTILSTVLDNTANMALTTRGK